MIGAQVLRVRRADIRKKAEPEALVDLERHGILRPEDQGGKANEEVLLFNHHVLFDYAVARLVFFRGRDAARLVDLLRAQRGLAVMLSPSLTLALSDAWNADRASFWAVAHALAEEPELPEVARLTAPMVVAEQAKTIDDLEPLLTALTGLQKNTAESIVQHLIGGLFVRERSGTPFTGPAAGPWMTFAEKLTAIGSGRLTQAMHALISKAVESL